MPDKKTILFVDDNPVDRALIQRLLEKNGFKVFLAETGPAGLKLGQEKKPDLILLDILLPGISGIELCKKFKKMPETSTVPVIFYTSIDTPKHLIDYKSYGAQDYIQKTMPTQELIAAIKDILK
jgi:DNA-binding response OmpR family regulator